MCFIKTAYMCFYFAHPRVLHEVKSRFSKGDSKTATLILCLMMQCNVSLCDEYCECQCCILIKVAMCLMCYEYVFPALVALLAFYLWVFLFLWICDVLFCFIFQAPYDNLTQHINLYISVIIFLPRCLLAKTYWNNLILYLKGLHFN